MFIIGDEKEERSKAKVAGGRHVFVARGKRGKRVLRSWEQDKKSGALARNKICGKR